MGIVAAKRWNFGCGEFFCALLIRPRYLKKFVPAPGIGFKKDVMSQKKLQEDVQKIVASKIATSTFVMSSGRERKVTPRFAPTVNLGALEVGEQVKARWLGNHYKGDRYYDAIITSIDGVQQTCALVFPAKMVPQANWDTDAACPMWAILRNDGCHAAQRPRQPLQRALAWQHDAMVKSFFAPQTEMNQTDAQRLMFSWKRTELENIFGDDIAETTTHTVSLHDIVCGPDANTNAMHVRALSDWMKMLLLTAPSETNMRTLLESQGDPHLTPLSPKQQSERQKIYKDYADGAAALKNLKNKK